MLLEDKSGLYPDPSSIIDRTVPELEAALTTGASFVHLSAGYVASAPERH
jgi:hypothetical protein